MTILRIGAKCNRKGFPLRQEVCPCDDCVEATESRHLTQMHEVWPHNAPYQLRSRSGADAASSLPPCPACLEKINSVPGGYVEVTYHVYAPLVQSDPIPFHHVKRALVHNACVSKMLDEHEMGISRESNITNRYMKQIDKFMRIEKQFPAQLARLVDYKG